TDPHLQYHPPSIPTIRSAPRRTEAAQAPAQDKPAQSKTQQAYQPPVTTTTSAYPEPAQGGRLNWGRIILAILLLGIVAAGVVFGMKYWRLQKEDSASLQNTTPVDTVAQAPVLPADTVAQEPVSEYEM